MSRQFTKVFEATLNRFKQGGILTGDIVKFKSNALSSDWAKKQQANLIEMLKEFMSSDKHIRVSTVKALRPAVAGSIQSNEQVDDWYCDITQEEAPGLYINYMTVPMDIIEKVDLGDNLPAVPDSMKYDPDGEKVTIKPEEVELEAHETEQNAVYGTKTNEGDKKLTDKNIKQTYSKEPTTAKYLKAM